MSQVTSHRSQVAGHRSQAVIYIFVGTLVVIVIGLNMGSIKSFEEFEVWITAREITCMIYAMTKEKVFAGDFTLKNQIRSASTSIMSNIAEGYESQTESVFIRHLGIAKGSAGEVRSQLYVALDQNYITKTEFCSLTELCKKVSRQIACLISYLKCCNK